MYSRNFSERNVQYRGQIQFSIKTLLLAVFCVAFLMILFQDDAGSRNHFGVFSPHFSALMATIYLWKYLIIQSRMLRSVRQMAFAILLVAAVPFVYWQC